MSVAGTKYTTARGVAERVTDQIIAKLGRTPVPCHTSVTPLPGSDLNDVTLAIRQAHTEFETRLSNDTIAHLVGAYGSSYRDVIQIADGCAAWLAPISESSPVIGAQLIWAVRHEMAMTLPDATIRRTPLGALGHPGAPAAKRAATLMAQECGWPAERIEAELSSLDRFYQL
jgi:glycerol-3-phosphate dehydrogenase